MGFFPSLLFAKVNKMAKQDILNTIGGKVKSNKESVAAVFDAIFDVLSGVERCRIPGFGTFERRTRAAREGLKPGTQEKISIPEKDTLAFKISTDFKKALNPEPPKVEAPKKGAKKAPAKAPVKAEVKAEVKADAPKATKKAAAKVEAPKVEAKVEAPKAAKATKAKK